MRVYRDHLFEYRRHPEQITACPDRGFGTDYRSRKAEHIKMIRYDHSLTGYVKPAVGRVKDIVGRFSDQQLEVVSNLYDG